ncbi:N-acetyltransferase B complex non catalytic subunit-domain-containing protein [Coniella lustricola]|uniref:N-acetyltransferase B complex non catalytic subunit-domain-containing protein n=1 Tax=Coniella lustricola TaxID=2025994 RepID=A0A2T3A740_9PEZI|nr:N-acetyltransferase B complex non catalytic subunit-domain-containing protein [Coniella lustricola]
MSGFGRNYRPDLKQTVDIQLQTAFNEGRWPSVVRLAAQRFKAKKDPYYEAVKVCAESQLDTVTEKSSIVVAIDALVRNKTAPVDVEALELFEWAMRDAGYPIDYTRTIGALRVRWVKANPTGLLALDCLEACVLAWDLVNAQQIAAALDKYQSSKTEGKSFFWSITLSHLLSTSPQCPDNMSPVFGKLSRMQLEKAATASQTADAKTPAHGLRKEEEINLYYRVIGKDAYIKAATDESSAISVAKQFSQGRKYLLTESLRTFEQAGEWDQIYDLCEYALTRKGDDDKPSFLAFDMRTWKLFVKAASFKSNSEAAFSRLTDVLDAFVAIQSTAPPMYKKNISLATLELAFKNPSILSHGSTPDKPSARVFTLYMILQQSLFQRAAFDDVKEYIAQLSIDEARYFIDNFSTTLLGDTPDEQRKVVVDVLEIKFRYLLTSCRATLDHVVVVGDAAEPQFTCLLCSATANGSCTGCLESLATSALSIYQTADKSSANLKGLAIDPRVDLALVAASALLRLSGLSTLPSQPPSRLPPLSKVNISRLLQAVTLISAQLTKSPDEIPLRILLVHLYLLLGCGSLAYQQWLPLDVKRTIQDSLSPLFFDRISSIAPNIFQGTRSPPTERLTSYYSGILYDEAPVRIWDAFKAGSYASILDMADYSDRLRRSCTLVMTVLEERATTRAFGGRLEGDIDESTLLSHLSYDTDFVNAVDYGSFPNLESPQSAPLHKLLQLGPELSSERCHLALLAEQFIDAVTYKPPKDFKPTKANDVAAHDRAYLIETSTRLHESLTTLLLRTPAANINGTTAAAPTPITARLTSAEHKYYTTICFLAAFLRTGLETPKTGGANPASTLSATSSGIKSTLASLQTDFASIPPRLAHLEAADVLASVTNPHTLSLLRETALVTKQTAGVVLAWHAAEQARDKSGKTGLHKDVVAEAKSLEDVAGKVLAEGKERVKALKASLGEGGWLDRVEGWMVSREDEAQDKLDALVRNVVGEAEMEEWAGRLVESWREGMKGMSAVKWE